MDRDLRKFKIMSVTKVENSFISVFTVRNPTNRSGNSNDDAMLAMQVKVSYLNHLLKTSTEKKKLLGLRRNLK